MNFRKQEEPDPRMFVSAQTLLWRRVMHRAKAIVQNVRVSTGNAGRAIFADPSFIKTKLIYRNNAPYLNDFIEDGDSYWRKT